MKKNINEELDDIKFLFKYKRGVVISEQIKEEDDDFEMFSTELEMDEQREVQIPVRPDVDTPTKPKKPGTPYRPKPGPKKAPKAEKGELPDWLTFDELGINFE
jgi:hypothetical protein